MNTNTKGKNLPVIVEDCIDDGFCAPCKSEYSGELSVGPVSFRSSSRSSDSGSSVIGGVLAGGAIAIGAVAVTLSLLGMSKSN